MFIFLNKLSYNCRSVLKSEPFLYESLLHNALSGFLVAKLLYKYKCPSVCPYVRQPLLGGNVIFSAPDSDIAPISFCADSSHK